MPKNMPLSSWMIPIHARNDLEAVESDADETPRRKDFLNRGGIRAECQPSLAPRKDRRAKAKAKSRDCDVAYGVDLKSWFVGIF